MPDAKNASNTAAAVKPEVAAANVANHFVNKIYDTSEDFASGMRANKLAFIESVKNDAGFRDKYKDQASFDQAVGRLSLEYDAKITDAIKKGAIKGGDAKSVVKETEEEAERKAGMRGMLQTAMQWIGSMFGGIVGLIVSLFQHTQGAKDLADNIADPASAAEKSKNVRAAGIRDALMNVKVGGKRVEFTEEQMNTIIDEAKSSDWNSTVELSQSAKSAAFSQIPEAKQVARADINQDKGFNAASGTTVGRAHSPVDTTLNDGPQLA